MVLQQRSRKFVNGLHSDGKNLNVLLQLQYEYFWHKNEAENLGDQKWEKLLPWKDPWCLDLNISIIIFNGLYSDGNNLNLLQLQYEYFLHNNEAENLGDQKGQMALPWKRSMVFRPQYKQHHHHHPAVFLSWNPQSDILP
jgi:hypothetical protein